MATIWWYEVTTFRQPKPPKNDGEVVAKILALFMVIFLTILAIIGAIEVAKKGQANNAQPAINVTK
jgi:hypothetical protein